jgi:hypothetical protein
MDEILAACCAFLRQSPAPATLGLTRASRPEAMAIACAAHHLSWATSKTRVVTVAVAAMERKMNLFSGSYG